MSLDRRPAPDPREDKIRWLGERMADTLPPAPDDFARLLEQLDTPRGD